MMFGGGETSYVPKQMQNLPNKIKNSKNQFGNFIRTLSAPLA